MAEEKLAVGTVSEEPETGKKSRSTDGKKSKKKAQGSRVAKYFRDLKGEFTKVIWPSFPAVVRNTLVVIAMCALVGVMVAVVDVGLSALVNWMLKL